MVWVCAPGQTGNDAKRDPNFCAKTNIKTKITLFPAALRGCNPDKLPAFLSEEDTVFMPFLFGINYEKRSIQAKLIPIFQNTPLDNAVVQNHWAGRNSRGFHSLTTRQSSGLF